MFASLPEAEQGAALLRAFTPGAKTGVAERPEALFCVTVDAPGVRGYFGSWPDIARFLLTFCVPDARPDIEAPPEV